VIVNPKTVRKIMRAQGLRVLPGDRPLVVGPSNLVPQWEIAAGKEPLQLTAGDGPGAVDPLAATLQAIGRVDGEPSPAVLPADHGPQGGQLPVPGGRRRGGVAAAEPAGQYRA
jgi:hypothetical protein